MLCFYISRADIARINIGTSKITESNLPTNNRKCAVVGVNFVSGVFFVVDWELAIQSCHRLTLCVKSAICGWMTCQSVVSLIKIFFIYFAAIVNAYGKLSANVCYTLSKWCLEQVCVQLRASADNVALPAFAAARRAATPLLLLLLTAGQLAVQQSIDIS